MISAAADLEEDAIEVVAVHRGEALNDPDQYFAAIITGSPAMVTDRDAWSERTAGWVRKAADAGLPMFGICYGHQLLAHAFGGVVDYHPQGREVGTQTIELLEGADELPFLQDLPASFPAHVLHQQSIIALPPGARVLARSSHDPHQIVQYREHVMSSQYHPEFDTGIMDSYLGCFRPSLTSEGYDVDTLLAGLEPTPHARELLLRFIERWAPSCALTRASQGAALADR